MPTTRRRHAVTETDEIALALDAAARLWPELRDDRTALLRKVIAQGAESIERRAAAHSSTRLRAIRTGAGALTGVYPPGEAQRLRDEWPE
ncbi:hypothetical protein [Microbacterium sp.]|jgi:hypothetical protein|uniref:hypothetical protein n=1 Tax=Microbacterium sp. TaxID=51671 RepID=UPI0025E42D96|nr:hypothetical protein [Microbacterium sp.]